ncbi:hypothetical protein [Acholeplasma hippikon]|nr:hypothetical protein [Acholeplasma hippikon]
MKGIVSDIEKVIQASFSMKKLIIKDLEKVLGIKNDEKTIKNIFKKK